MKAVAVVEVVVVAAAVCKFWVLEIDEKKHPNCQHSFVFAFSSSSFDSMMSKSFDLYLHFAFCIHFHPSFLLNIAPVAVAGEEERRISMRLLNQQLLHLCLFDVHEEDFRMFFLPSVQLLAFVAMEGVAVAVEAMGKVENMMVVRHRRFPLTFDHLV